MSNYLLISDCSHCPRWFWSLKNKVFQFFPIYFDEVMGLDALFPNKGSHSGPLHWEHWVLSIGPPGEFLLHMWLEPNWDLNVSNLSISRSDHFKENIYLPLKINLSQIWAKIIVWKFNKNLRNLPPPKPPTYWIDGPIWTTRKMMRITAMGRVLDKNLFSATKRSIDNSFPLTL